MSPSRRPSPRALAPVLLAALLALPLAACGDDGDEPSGSSAPTTLRFGASGSSGRASMDRYFGPLKKELEGLLGVEIVLQTTPSRSAAAAAMGAGKLDLLLSGPAEYVAMRSKMDVVPLVGFRHAKYYNVVAVHKGSGIGGLKDLRGKSVAMTDPTSGSGYIWPTKLLMDAGLKPGRDVDTKLLGDAQAQAFISGKVDAMATYPANYELMLKLGKLEPSDAPIVYRGPLLPPELISASARLPDDYVRKISDLMVDDGRDIIDAIYAGAPDILGLFEDSRPVRVTDASFDPMREAYRRVGQGDLAEKAPPGE